MVGPGDLDDVVAVDVHTHFVDPDSVAAMAGVTSTYAPSLARSDGGWTIHLPAGLSRRHRTDVTRTVPSGLVDLDRRLADMKAQNDISCQALSAFTALNFYALEPKLAHELNTLQNDGMVRAAREHPGRFLAIPHLTMQDPAIAADEVADLARQPEVCAVGIGTNIDGRDLDDPSFDVVWEALDRHDLPVVVHPPALVAAEDRLDDYHLVNLIGNPLDSTIAIARLVCSGVFERYERLRFCFVHGGGFAPYQLGRWDHGWEVRDETSRIIKRPPSEYFDRIFFDSLTHSAASLKFLGERFGWGQVMVGTDYPWDMATETPLDDVTAAGVSDDELTLVARSNPERFLRWPSAVSS